MAASTNRHPTPFRDHSCELKICVLVIAVLAVMRTISWLLGWALARLLPLRAKFIAIAANVAGFAGFAALLIHDMLPGEPLDVAALLFGLVTFAACCMTDFYWRPWKLKG